MALSSAFFAAVMFSLASIMMILVNKAAVIVFPHSAVLLCMQTGATILIAVFKEWWRPSKTDTSVFNLTSLKQLVLSWLPVGMFFSLNILSSLQALKFVSVPTFSVFRNLNTFLVALIEYGLLKSSAVLSKESLIGMLGMLAGAIVYTLDDLTFSFHGYLWCAAHISFMACYVTLVKVASQKPGSPPPAMMSLANNILGLPMLLVIAWAGMFDGNSSSEHAIGAAVFTRAWQEFKGVYTISIVGVSCVAGWMISVSAFHAQRTLSATSFIALNNINKIPAFLISMYWFNDSINLLMTIGILISLMSAFYYGQAQKKGTSADAKSKSS